MKNLCKNLPLGVQMGGGAMRTVPLVHLEAELGSGFQGQIQG
jgi:hypothetical protein